ncbi:MAG: Holliday junction resolvase RuvX [Firmicutes bacterium]|nr:Holliday junction resolvase RuvX [Bacillota bacterium]
MRILGLDLGEKTIGVAVSDELGWTAQGLTVIRRKSLKDDFAALSEIIKEKEVEKIVLGMPRRTDGTYGPEADKVRSFGEKLSRRLKLEVEYWDERFTTAAAERALLEGDVSRKKRSEVIDQVAASLILQSYLDRK